MTLLAAGTARNRRIGIATMCGMALCYCRIDVVVSALFLLDREFRPGS